MSGGLGELKTSLLSVGYAQVEARRAKVPSLLKEYILYHIYFIIYFIIYFKYFLRIWLFLGDSQLYEDHCETSLEPGRALGASDGLYAPHAHLRMAKGERATRAEGGELSHPWPIRRE